jgi:hypothetical protein
MNVTELYGLAEWYKTKYPELYKRYYDLQTTLTHNANNPNQQPVEGGLNDLINFLREMNLGELSLQQLTLLSDLKVENLIGPTGAHDIAQTVKTASYDPASTASKLQAAVNAISLANERLSAFSTAVSNLGIAQSSYENEEGQFIVRVGFKNKAEIENIVNWKESSEEWFHIIRGLALVAGEAPENTKIVGVANGSIILVLATTCAMTSLLARIAKHISSAGKEVISLGSELESLRQKRFITKTMENEFAKLQKKAREEGLKAINDEIAALIPKETQGDVKTALEKSISSLLKFGEAGGELDFVVPPTENDAEISAEDDVGTITQNEIEKLREIVHQYQEAREAIKLLTHSKRGEGGALDL